MIGAAIEIVVMHAGALAEPERRPRRSFDDQSYVRVDATSPGSDLSACRRRASPAKNRVPMKQEDAMPRGDKSAYS
ncbi:MAG TPA: hypothetical protein VFS55_09370, partial [Dokdonella sp.]|nr:hypothetical protein [Dokdonella sp.]